MRMTTLGTALVVLGIATGSAIAQTQPPRGQNMAFCLEGSTGDKNCGFATMAQCNAAKTGQSDKCSQNPQATTGSGSGMAPSGTAPAPGGTGAPSR